MAKWEIPTIKIYFGEIDEISKQLGQLQTYKLFEGADEKLVDVNEVMRILAGHVKVTTAEPEQRWIPVSERLPEDGDYHDLCGTPDGAILWCKETGEVGVGWYYESTKNWCDLWDNGVKDIVAWMPLPEPYREE